MTQWRPDPTFYPSPKMAMQAEPEKLAFVALLNPSRQGASDALAVVDVEPSSRTDGGVRLCGCGDLIERPVFIGLAVVPRREQWEWQLEGPQGDRDPG